jgi:hypothetical protein
MPVICTFGIAATLIQTGFLVAHEYPRSPFHQHMPIYCAVMVQAGPLGTNFWPQGLRTPTGACFSSFLFFALSTAAIFISQHPNDTSE